MDVKKAMQELNDFIPTPYEVGKWYPAITTTGAKVEIKKTSPGFLHLRHKAKQVLKDKDGNIMENYSEVFVVYRVDLKNGTMKRL